MGAVIINKLVAGKQVNDSHSSNTSKSLVYSHLNRPTIDLLAVYIYIYIYIYIPVSIIYLQQIYGSQFDEAHQQT